MIPLTQGAFSDWGVYFSYGIPSAIMVCSEFWIYEVITFMAAYLGSTHLATITIITNLVSANYEIACGLGEAVTSLVGRFLGDEWPVLAKKVAIAGLGIQSSINLVNILVIVCFPSLVISVFTDNQEIKKSFIDNIFLLCLTISLDTLQGIMSAIIRGIGAQTLSSLVNFSAYFVVSVPLMYFLSFTEDWGIAGLLFGYSLGIMISLGFNGYLCLSREWKSSVSED